MTSGLGADTTMTCGDEVVVLAIIDLIDDEIEVTTISVHLATTKESKQKKKKLLETSMNTNSR